MGIGLDPTGANANGLCERPPPCFLFASVQTVQDGDDDPGLGRVIRLKTLCARSTKTISVARRENPRSAALPFAAGAGHLAQGICSRLQNRATWDLSKHNEPHARQQRTDWRLAHADLREY